LKSYFAFYAIGKLLLRIYIRDEIAPSHVRLPSAPQQPDGNTAALKNFHVQLKTVQQSHAHKRRRVSFVHQDANGPSIPKDRAEVDVAFAGTSISEDDRTRIVPRQPKFYD
jgi:hypothetical protein